MANLHSGLSPWACAFVGEQRELQNSKTGSSSVPLSLLHKINDIQKKKLLQGIKVVSLLKQELNYS